MENACEGHSLESFISENNVVNSADSESFVKTYFNLNDEECAVCLDGTSFEGNEILFCDKCNVPVHRGCYGVATVPDGSWYCDLCSQGGDPSITKCRLCPFTHGAYKATENPNEWVHALCAMWIPEIFCPDNVNMPSFIINSCDKARFRLKCAVCGTKHGACIQCAYGRCITSAHPSCALDRTSGYTHRIIKNPDYPGTMDWDIFCVQHATSVKDNLKKKCNAKRARIVDSVNNVDEIDDDINETAHESNRRTKGGKAIQKQSRTKRDFENDTVDEVVPSASDGSPRKTSRPRGRPPKAGRKDYIDSNSREQSTTPRNKANGRNRNRNRRTSRSGYSDEDNGEEGSDDSLEEYLQNFPDTTHEQPAPVSSTRDMGEQMHSFPVHLMSEWPGQAIGEAMDLEHFWNVASMLYPEDQSNEWLEFMSKPLLHITELPDDPNPLGTAPLHNFSQLVAESDEAYLAVGVNDRDRNNAFDLDKRQQLLESALCYSLDLLSYKERHQKEEILTGIGSIKIENEGVASETVDEKAGHELKIDSNIPESDFVQEMLSASDDTRMLTMTDKSNDIKASGTSDRPHPQGKGQGRFRPNNRDSTLPQAPSLASRGADALGRLPLCLRNLSSGMPDESYYFISSQPVESNKLTELAGSMDQRETPELKLRMAIDGATSRTLCEYVLNPSIGRGTDPSDEDWRRVVLGNELEGENEWVSMHLLRAVNPVVNVPPERTEGEPACADANEILDQVGVRLLDYAGVPNDTAVLLPPHGNIIARDQDDEVCRMIRADTEAYRFCINAVKQRARYLLDSSGINESIEKNAVLRKVWASTEEKYLQQRVWKRVAVFLVEGMKDQRPGFNKENVEATPASWTLRVDGRPKPEDKKERDGKERDEDLICMCCFNGTSVEGNEILYCDGCNCPMHQACYGVPEIPEGDFYCNRCRTVQLMADELYQEQGAVLENPRELVKCCLCPILHGGLKPTTDGRWVHLCCAWWCGRAVIHNLVDMEPVDISLAHPVPDGPDQERSGRRGRRSRPPGSRIISSFYDDDEDEDDSNLNRLMLSSNDEGSKEYNVLSFQNQKVISNDKYEDNSLSTSTVEVAMLSESACGVSTDYTNERVLSSAVSAFSFEVQSKTFKDHQTDSTMAQPLTCTVCQLSSGFITTCAEECCSTAFHPICAWFHGIFVKTELLDPSFCHFLETKDVSGVAYPASGLLIKFLCNKHCPPEVGGPSIRRDQAALRGKYRIAGDDLDYLPGQQRKRKKRKSTGSVIAAGPSTTAGSSTASNQGRVANAAVNQPKDLEPDIYTENECAACLQPFSTPIHGSSSKYENDILRRLQLLQCSKCKISVHHGCYPKSQEIPEPAAQPHLGNESGPSNDKSVDATTDESGALKSSTTAADWTCATCTAGETQLRCVLCPRIGGALLPTGDGRFAHIFCGRHAPGMTRVSREGRVEIRMLPKEGKKLKCGICNRKNGTSVHCKSVGCSAVFHPHCAERSKKCYVSIRQGYSSAYCADHIPAGVFLLPSGQWVDLNEIRNFRHDMENSRILIKLILEREKVKLAVYQAHDETFYRRTDLLLDKLKRMNDSNDGLNDFADFFDDDSISNENMSQTQNETPALTSGRKRGRPKTHRSESFDELDEHGTEKGTGEKLKLPPHTRPFAKSTSGRTKKSLTPEEIAQKNLEEEAYEKLTIMVSGQYVSRDSEILELDRDDFIRAVHRDIRRNVAANRKDIGIFSSEKEAKEFRNDLGPHVDLYLKSTLAEAQLALATAGEEVTEELPEEEQAAAPVEVPKKRGRVAGRGPSKSVETETESVDETQKSDKQQEKLSLKLKISHKEKREVVEDKKRGRSSAGSLPGASVPHSDDEENLKISIKKTKSKRNSVDISGDVAVQDAVVEEPHPPRKHKKSDAATVPIDTGLPLIPILSRRYGNGSHDGCVDLLKTFYNSTKNLPGIERWQYKGGGSFRGKQELLYLEGRIQDALYALQYARETPSKTNDLKPRSGKDSKKARNSTVHSDISQLEKKVDKDDNGRLIGEVFAGESSVLTGSPCAQCFDDLVDKLMRHEYHSWSAFEKDVVDMFNYGRLSHLTAQMMSDTEALLALLNQPDVSCGSGRLYITSHLENQEQPLPEDCSLSTAICSFCSNKFVIESWPDVSSMTSIEKRVSPRLTGSHLQRESLDVQWAWCCPTCACTPEHRSTLLGRDIKVWWREDERFYCGHIDDFEPVRQRHKVTYADNTFELIEIHKEAVLIEKRREDASEALEPVLLRPAKLVDLPEPSLKPEEPAGKKLESHDRPKRNASGATGSGADTKSGSEVKADDGSMPYKPIPKKKKPDTSSVSEVPKPPEDLSSEAGSSRRNRSSKASVTPTGVLDDNVKLEPVAGSRALRAASSSMRREAEVDGKDVKVSMAGEDRHIQANTSTTANKKQSKITPFLKKS